MKALALVVSARERGNCFDFASYVFDHLATSNVETEVVNFCNHKILMCQGCKYECMRTDIQSDGTVLCPINDDVRSIWEKTWNVDILLLVIPTYRGYPPAAWIAFLQRNLGLKPLYHNEATFEKLKRSVVSAIVLASPHGAASGEWTPAIVAGNVKWMKQQVACFEVINTLGFGPHVVDKRLIEEEEIRRRLDFLAVRTLTIAKEVSAAT